jgi:ankyrin repeat protein
MPRVLDQSPLSVACIVADADIVALCCACDANVHLTDRNGDTPLHHAVRRQPHINWLIVNTLLMNGAW